MTHLLASFPITRSNVSKERLHSEILVQRLTFERLLEHSDRVGVCRML